ncbi:unnamed protein product [Sphagnum jensenii]|uniref:Recombination activating protein 1 n=1 Tax=Sphagnum jensenii TaxID=128206 RepID=A0ABP1AN97_9BRYO
MCTYFKNLEKPPKVPSPIHQKESNRTYWLMLAESMESKVFNLSSDDEICKETSIGCKVICNNCSLRFLGYHLLHTMATSCKTVHYISMHEVAKLHPSHVRSTV